MTADNKTDLTQLTGLERVQRFADQANRRFGIAGFLAYDVTRVEDGLVEFRYDAKPEHLNLFSTIHGGVLASLLDTVMGWALLTLLDAGERHTIIDLHTKFVRPVPPDASALRVIGQVDYRGRRQCTMRGSILMHADRLCASGSATAMILGKRGKENL